MTVTQAVLSFAQVAGLLTIVPGLDTALVLRSAISRGRAHAFAAIVLATGFASRWLSGGVVARVTDRVTGVVLVAFGVRLAATARALPA